MEQTLGITLPSPRSSRYRRILFTRSQIMGKIPHKISELTLSSNLPRKIRKITYVIILTAVISLLACLYYMNSEMVKLENRCKDMEKIIDLNSRTLIGVYQYLIDKEKEAKILSLNQIVDNQRVVKF